MGGGQSVVFQRITQDDLIIAFFPCIEFSCIAQTWYSLSQRDMRDWEEKKRFDYMIDKNRNRAKMFELLYKLCGLSMMRNIRMIFENPYSINTYLKQNVFLKKPAIIDRNRKLRGDWFNKPTAFWFFNCEPTYGQSYQNNKEAKKDIAHCRKSPQKGVCSEERSMISPDYARNFICDFILGKVQKHTQLQLF